jgi:transposase
VGEIIRIGMDTSKAVFQLHGVNRVDEVVLRRKLRRSEVLAFFAKLEPTVVVLEACAASHHWGRELGKLGHEARLIPPQYSKPYVKRNKNDAADAAGLCEAGSRPHMRYVPIKSAEEQADLMLTSTRDLLVRERTQLSNAIRGHAAEFGLVAAKGLDKIEPLLERIAADRSLPERARKLFEILGRQYAQLDARIEEIEQELKAWFKTSEQARRLADAPGLGPITASLLVMKTPDPKSFKSGRDFAAWIGLTPKDHSTAGRVRLGVITRAGDEALRSALVCGATSVIKQVQRGKGPNWPWLKALLARKPPKLAAVALANKLARIAWKMLTTGERFRPEQMQPRAAA